MTQVEKRKKGKNMENEKLAEMYVKAALNENVALRRLAWKAMFGSFLVRPFARKACQMLAQMGVNVK